MGNGFGRMGLSCGEHLHLLCGWRQHLIVLVLHTNNFPTSAMDQTVVVLPIPMEIANVVYHGANCSWVLCKCLFSSFPFPYCLSSFIF